MSEARGLKVAIVEGGKSPDLYCDSGEFRKAISINRPDTNSIRDLNIYVLKAQFSVFIRTVIPDLDEDIFDKNPYYAHLLNYVVSEYVAEKFAGLKVGDKLEFTKRNIELFWLLMRYNNGHVIPSETMKEIILKELVNEQNLELHHRFTKEFDPFESGNPYLLITKPPKFLESLMEKESEDSPLRRMYNTWIEQLKEINEEEYKKHYEVKIRPIESPFDGDILNECDLKNGDNYDEMLSPAELRKRIKYAKSYQERKKYQQLLSGIPKNKKHKKRKKK